MQTALAITVKSLPPSGRTSPAQVSPPPSKASSAGDGSWGGGQGLLGPSQSPVLCPKPGQTEALSGGRGPVTGSRCLRETLAAPQLPQGRPRCWLGGRRESRALPEVLLQESGHRGKARGERDRRRLPAGCSMAAQEEPRLWWEETQEEAEQSLRSQSLSLPRAVTWRLPPWRPEWSSLSCSLPGQACSCPSSALAGASM